MKRQNLIVLVATLALIGSAAAGLGWMRSHQQLGTPGVKTEPIPGTQCVKVLLPADVLDYQSRVVEQDAMVTNSLPRDTSYGQRYYRSPDDFGIQMNVVLMGADRTSIHKPQFCLVGAGWHIDKTEQATVMVGGAHPYELPVMKLTTSKEIMMDGQPVAVRGVYIYWFVADGSITAQHWERMWWMARDLMSTGVLQRWAYVTCFSICHPGQEDAVFDRMKEFIAAAAPQFQLSKGGSVAGTATPLAGK